MLNIGKAVYIFECANQFHDQSFQCVSVRERETEGGRESERVREWVCVCVCVCVCSGQARRAMGGVRVEGDGVVRGMGGGLCQTCLHL